MRRKINRSLFKTKTRKKERLFSSLIQSPRLEKNKSRPWEGRERERAAFRTAEEEQ